MVYLKWYVFCAFVKTLSSIKLICTGDQEFLDIWNESYASVMQHSRSGDGFWVGLVVTMYRTTY